jgi:hypothetical protein
LLLLAAGTAALAQHGFHDAERWAKEFDDPARDAWQKPDEVIRALSPAPDAVVADIGAGTGYFAVRLGRARPRGLRGSLRAGARLAIIDFRPDSPYGPPPGGRVPPAQAKRELARAGFELLAEHDFLPYQYFLVLRVP